MKNETYTSEHIELGRNQTGILFTPLYSGEKSRTAILVMHSDSAHFTLEIAKELAAYGYTSLWSAVSDARAVMDKKIMDVGNGVKYLRELPDVDRVILHGHSGGATLMTAYQSIAENGPAIFQKPGMLASCSDKLAGLCPADGLLLIDANWGNGAMVLFSLDPAVITEGDGRHLDPELDLFNPANGFTPEGAFYSDAFIQKFQKAQGERNNRIIDAALDRLESIERGWGAFTDDEPFVVVGAASGFMNNKLFAQDVRLMARTRKPHLLLRGDGSAVTQIINTVRKPQNFKSFTSSYREGAIVTTVRSFLSLFGVRTTDEYGYGADYVRGIDWESSYNCTTGNITGVKAPLLVMGMTGGWEFACAEAIYEGAGSTDKTLAYVEGATHVFTPARDCEQFQGQFGDTVKTTYNFIDQWLGGENRF